MVTQTELDGEAMANKHKLGLQGEVIWGILAGGLLALVAPFTPVVAGAIEVALFDTHLAAEWLRSTAVEDTIADYYRALGWPL